MTRTLNLSPALGTSLARAQNPAPPPLPPRSDVPCNGCTACCRNELLFLYPEHGDRPERYETQVAENPLARKLGRALAQKPNGDCFYLGEGGCTIHDKAPALCRTFDCRKFVRNFGGRQQQRRALRAGHMTKEVYAAGRARMATLEGGE